MNAASKLEAMIQSSQMKIEGLKNELANEARRLADRMQLVILKLEEGCAVNPLGEVQSRGVEIDRLCVLLDNEEKNIRMLKFIAEQG